jgi:HK97 family phage prohead protease
MPAEFTRCVLALKEQGQSEDSAFATCTEQFKRRHKGKTPQEVAKESAEAAEQAADIAEEVERFETGNQLSTFAHTYFQCSAPTFVINSVNSKTREIRGYASVFNEPMRDDRVITSTAFPQDTIDLFMTNPVLLRNHDPNRPVGNVLSLSVDEVGLVATARVDDKETLDDIEAGRIRAFSWAGNIVEHHFESKNSSSNDKEEQFFLDKAALLEISVVTIPNSPQSLFEIVKSHTGGADDFSVWAPIRNIDKEQRMVYGYATVFNEPDAERHIMTKEAVIKAVEEYRPWSNIREMHQYRAVGTATVLEVDDYGLWVGAHISEAEEECWIKIQDRTYKGFSLGGAVTKWADGTHPEYQGSFTYLNQIRIDEITVCDRPKVASATFQLVKRQSDSPHAQNSIPEESNKAPLIPLTTKDRSWNALEAVERVKSWAKASENPNEEYAKAFLLIKEDGEGNNDYKLPFTDIVDGGLVAVPEGIFAAAEVLGRVEAEGISPCWRSGLSGARDKISSFYDRMRREFSDDSIRAPWEINSQAANSSVQDDGGFGLDTTTLEARKLGILQNILAAFGFTKPDQESLYDLGEGGEGTPEASNKVTPDQVNRAMTKATENQLAEIKVQIEATQTQLAELLSKVQPSTDEGESKEEDGIKSGEATLNKVVPTATLNADLISKTKDHISNGMSRVDAYNTALHELTGDDSDKALALLGITDEILDDSEGKEKNPHLTSEQIVALVGQTVQTTMAPYIEQIKSEMTETRNSVARSKGSSRVSGGFVPEVANQANSEADVWGSLEFPAKRGVAR